MNEDIKEITREPSDEELAKQVSDYTVRDMRRYPGRFYDSMTD